MPVSLYGLMEIHTVPMYVCVRTRSARGQLGARERQQPGHGRRACWVAARTHAEGALSGWPPTVIRKGARGAQQQNQRRRRRTPQQTAPGGAWVASQHARCAPGSSRPSPTPVAPPAHINEVLFEAFLQVVEKDALVFVVLEQD